MIILQSRTLQHVHLMKLKASQEFIWAVKKDIGDSGPSRDSRVDVAVSKNRIYCLLFGQFVHYEQSCRSVAAFL